MTDDEIGALLTLARSGQDHAIPVNPGSVRASGTQRRRRRTAAVSGAAATLVIGGVVAFVALTGPGDDGHDAEVVDARAVLGPDGYGDLKLGMSREQAEATGLVDIGDGEGAGQACFPMELTDHPTPADVTSGYYSNTVGVAAIYATDDMETPEGIGLGDTLPEVRAAYPDLESGVNGYSVPVEGHPGVSYYFGIEQDGTLSEFAVQLDSQDCVG